MLDGDAHGTIEAVWRAESARLIASLTRLVNDVGLAEELAQDSLVAALEQWPAEGVPRNPGAWLMTVAKRRAVDLIRRSQSYDRKLAEVGRVIEQETESADFDAVLDEQQIEDDLLRLVFIACHPVLSAEARAALTLRLLGGLTTDEIARAFLVPESTVAQRVVRAKRTLAKEKVPFEVPEGDGLIERLASVLEVIYLIFNEGYTATAGDELVRVDLCGEAIRLGRLLTGLLPEEPEVYGLTALMEIQASRTPARTDADGELITLLEQDRSLWNRSLISSGLAALDSALSCAAKRLDNASTPPKPDDLSALPRRAGPYTLQAAIAACHARADSAEATDWARIAAYYAELVVLSGSPVVELNRAVAVSYAEGPAPALEILDALADEPSMKSYHLLPSVRGDLLTRLGRHLEAREEFERAASLTRNERERRLLQGRASAAVAAATSAPARAARK